MIPPVALEICVVCLGIFLLMAESFSFKSNKVTLAHGAIFGLLCVFVLSFFIESNPAAMQNSGFYVVDGLSLSSSDLPCWLRFSLSFLRLTTSPSFNGSCRPSVRRLVPASFSFCPFSPAPV
jgi:hypothetical protein